VILHEYDHMLGQNFTMRASSLKIQRALKSLDKKVKNYHMNKGNS
jgi:peptide deformylase